MPERKSGVSACIFNNEYIYVINESDIGKYCIGEDSWESVKIEIK